MTTDTPQELIDHSELAKWSVIAGIVAAIVNVIVFFIAQTMGVFDELVVIAGGGNDPFSILPIILTSIILILIGGGVMWLIDRFSERPITIWRIVAIVALVLSYGLPFAPDTLANADIPVYVTLILMHTIAGVITIYLLTTRVRQTA